MKRGAGIACSWYGIGNTSLSNPSEMKIGIAADGRFTLYCGAVDIGQGSNTILVQIAADALGVSSSDIRLVMGDTARTLDAGKTSASRQTFVTGKACELAALDLKAKLAQVTDRAVLRDLPPDNHGDVLTGYGKFDPPTTPLDANGQGVPYACYGFATQVALVEVDLELGTVKVLRIAAAHDVGKAVNPQQVEGQIHGGTAQGIGLALMEEYIPGRTENLHDYLIPTFGDMPEMICKIVEAPTDPRPARREGRGRAGPDLDRARHLRRHLSCDRRARDQGPGAAAPPARRDPRQGGEAMSEAVAASAPESDGIVRCDACPVLCRIRPGKLGACDRYGNVEGKLVRTDPLVLLDRSVESGRGAVRFLEGARDWSGELVRQPDAFVTGIGATTTYPDYKPAPFIVSSQVDGVDCVTVVTEGIFSYCGVKVKIDTDRYVGPEQAAVRVKGEQIGHVTTHEYGSQMLSLGGVRHLTGGSKAEGNITCDALMRLCNKEAVEMSIDGGSSIVVQADKAPIVDGHSEERMRVGCGSAVTGIFAKQWFGLADEVVVVDEHITGIFTEHQAGRMLDARPSGIKIRGRKSTPGRYFQVAKPGLGWGGTDLKDPLEIVERFDPKVAWPGLRLFMVSTTGEHHAWYVLDEELKPRPADPPADIDRLVARIAENCEPALSTVLFMGGAGGSLARGRHRESRAPHHVGEGSPDARHLRRRAGLCVAGRRHHGDGGCRAHAGPLDRLRADAGTGLPDRVHHAAGGLPVDGRAREAHRAGGAGAGGSAQEGGRAARGKSLADEPAERGRTMSAQASLLPGNRLHLHHGPIDLIISADGAAADVRRAYQVAAAMFPNILPELVAKLAVLRAPIGELKPVVLNPIARRMVDAVWPYRDVFVTPMAAVAGSVAEHVLALMVEAAPLRRVIVNNGGDIAIHLAEGEVDARRRGGRSVAAQDGRGHRDREQRSGARHRDLRLARPLAVPGHRGFRHRAGAERGDGGRGGDHDRQRGQCR